MNMTVDLSSKEIEEAIKEYVARRKPPEANLGEVRLVTTLVERGANQMETYIETVISAKVTLLAGKPA